MERRRGEQQGKRQRNGKSTKEKGTAASFELYQIDKWCPRFNRRRWPQLPSYGPPSLLHPNLFSPFLSFPPLLLLPSSSSCSRLRLYHQLKAVLVLSLFLCAVRDRSLALNSIRQQASVRFCCESMLRFAPVSIGSCEEPTSLDA
jgi:hypothetical protein